MATYKVPQDVEAEDKLIGPFSFRQFIYLIIAALAGFIAYMLGKIFWPLGLIPAPIIIFFLAIALPLKKDQPMETYLAAMVRFWMKPRLRLWDPEGELALVEITAPKTDDGPVLKNFTGQEASERLKYLSQVVDTGGWATRGLTSPIDNLSLNDTVVTQIDDTEDILDDAGSVAQNFDFMIAESDQARLDAAKQNMQQAVSTSQQTPPPPQTTNTSPQAPQASAASPQNQTTQSVSDVPVFNPYPTAIHQKIISPASQTTTVERPPAQQAQAPSEEPVSPDIIRLATDSKGLSVSTIAREAERLEKKRHLDEDEVVVSFRE